MREAGYEATTACPVDGNKISEAEGCELAKMQSQS